LPFAGVGIGVGVRRCSVFDVVWCLLAFALAFADVFAVGRWQAFDIRLVFGGLVIGTCILMCRHAFGHAWEMHRVPEEIISEEKFDRA
jgi:hypothetical protein